MSYTLTYNILEKTRRQAHFANLHYIKHIYKPFADTKRVSGRLFSFSEINH